MDFFAFIVAAFCTAALSSTFGMAGGMLLMGVYTTLLPVPEAMVLHGLTQAIANGLRASLWRAHIAWEPLFCFILGAICITLVSRYVSPIPPTWMVYGTLGVLPFMALALPSSLALNGFRPTQALLGGAVVNAAQVLAGAAGPVLDVFFARTDRDRFAVVATKSATQTASHLAKITVFVALVHDTTTIAQAALPVMVAAVAGTFAGAKLLERLPEASFRRWTRSLVLVMGAGYLLRAAQLTLG